VTEEATIGAVGGATGTVADGIAGASLALRVTRTVSFLRGIAAVCFFGTLGSSLMGLVSCENTKAKKWRECQTRNFIFANFFGICPAAPKVASEAGCY
jgi:hypothetical protein